MPGKVATPATAATVTVPASVEPPGLAAIATVTFPAKPVAMLANASWAVTTTAGVIVAPAAALLGWVEKMSVAAVAAAMLNPADVAAVSGALVACSV